MNLIFLGQHTNTTHLMIYSFLLSRPRKFKSRSKRFDASRFEGAGRRTKDSDGGSLVEQW